MNRRNSEEYLKRVQQIAQDVREFMVEYEPIFISCSYLDLDEEPKIAVSFDVVHDNGKSLRKEHNDEKLLRRSSC